MPKLFAHIYSSYAIPFLEDRTKSFWAKCSFSSSCSISLEKRRKKKRIVHFLLCRFSISYTFLSHSVFVYWAIITQLKRRRRRRRRRKRIEDIKEKASHNEQWWKNFKFQCSCEHVCVCECACTWYDYSIYPNTIETFLCLTNRNKMAFEKVRLNMRLIPLQEILYR